MANILIVDDNEQNAEIMEDLLCTWGHKVYKADEGTKAFTVIREHKLDVIILDVMLPGMNGFEICKKIKNNPETENIPIIMLTALTEVEDRLRGFNVGADVFLSRPIVYQELKNRVDWAISSKKVFNNMEETNRVVNSFLQVMKLKDNSLYLHACNVKHYCEKVGKILLVTDEEMERLIIGAYMHDVGKLISDTYDGHLELGIAIVEPLKMCKWLNIFIRNHHEKMNGEGTPDGLKENQMSLELKIIITINRFVQLLEKTDDKKISIEQLSTECKRGYWSTDILDALKQVLNDEKFIESINY